MNIVLGVTGGIAAYKAVSLARLFVEMGHELHVVPTESALRFVGAPTWEAISRHPVTTSVHDDVPEVRHVALGQRADLVVVAPATANTLAKMAAGIAEDLLGTTLLATSAPVLVAPAMHTEMWQHASVQHNAEVLRQRGVQLIGPENGRLTGDDSGLGRMSEPEQIFARALELLAERLVPESLVPERLAPHRSGSVGDLAGTRVLVTAGGTREPIDPVRFLGNRSSGKQGVEIAAEAAVRGAEVTLITANVEAELLSGLTPNTKIVVVGSAAQLEAAVRAAEQAADVIVMAAAVADYRVAEVAAGKLRKEDHAEDPVLHLVQNPDILRGIVDHQRTDQLIVGFAAETVESDAELLERGRRKLARKGCDLLAVNAVSWTAGFESEHNELLVLAKGGDLVSRTSGSKRETASALLDAIVAIRTK